MLHSSHSNGFGKVDEPNEVDVVIIGAGVAGLSAAAELQKRGVSYIILEAQDHIGGRCITRETDHGTRYNPGAHWVHGRGDNQLASLIKKNDLAYTDDPVTQIYSLMNDVPYKETLRNRMGIAAGGNEEISDRKLGRMRVESILDDDGRYRELFAARARRGWMGVSSPDDANALEVTRDPYGAGGWQLDAGMEQIPTIIAREIPREKILVSRPVKLVEQKADHVCVSEKNGTQWKAKKLICTASLGALKNDTLIFHPPAKTMLGKSWNGLTMGNFAKLILEVSPKFHKAHEYLNNARMDFFNDESVNRIEPDQILLFPGGKPIITALFGGDAAVRAELHDDGNPEYLKNVVLAKIGLLEELRGTKGHVVGKPILTDWHRNPYTKGAYSSCRVGGNRSGPVQFHKIIFAGEAFDDHAPGHVTGAWRSGKRAGKMVAEKLQKHTRHAEHIDNADVLADPVSRLADKYAALKNDPRTR
jgi:monoamine oxidase